MRFFGTKWLPTVSAAFLLIAVLPAEASAGDQTAPLIQNFSTPGNLETTHSLGCIELKDASPQYNPVDLYGAVKACTLAHRYDEAVRLFGLAGAYGRFDTLRVADATAHDAVNVAGMSIFGNTPEPEAKGMRDSMSRIFLNPGNPAYCQEIVRIGPPVYYPRYMVQHGMGAVLGARGDGLVEHFDAKAAWKTALDTYLHCAT